MQTKDCKLGRLLKILSSGYNRNNTEKGCGLQNSLSQTFNTESMLKPEINCSWVKSSSPDEPSNDLNSGPTMARFSTNEEIAFTKFVPVVV